MPDRFEHWAIVELMGHQRVAGRVSEQTIGSSAFVRVDVPATQHSPAFTKCYGPAAIYCITVTDEATARAAAEYDGPQPMEKWSLQQIAQSMAARIAAPRVQEDAPGASLPTYNPDNETCQKCEYSMACAPSTPENGDWRADVCPRQPLHPGKE